MSETPIFPLPPGTYSGCTKTVLTQIEAVSPIPSTGVHTPPDEAWPRFTDVDFEAP
jgi:hypothetical protein